MNKLSASHLETKIAELNKKQSEYKEEILSLTNELNELINQKGEMAQLRDDAYATYIHLGTDDAKANWANAFHNEELLIAAINMVTNKIGTLNYRLKNIANKISIYNQKLEALQLS